jgi:hypothetical protein
MGSGRSERRRRYSAIDAKPAVCGSHKQFRVQISFLLWYISLREGYMTFINFVLRRIFSVRANVFSIRGGSYGKHSDQSNNWYADWQNTI